MDIISSIYVFLLFAVVATGHLEACRLNAHVPPIRSRGSAAPQPSLQTDPEVSVVFLVGQDRERRHVINQLIPPKLFFHTYLLILSNTSYFLSVIGTLNTVHLAVFSFANQNLLPFIVSVRLLPVK